MCRRSNGRCADERFHDAWGFRARDPQCPPMHGEQHEACVWAQCKHIPALGRGLKAFLPLGNPVGTSTVDPIGLRDAPCGRVEGHTGPDDSGLSMYKIDHSAGRPVK